MLRHRPSGWNTWDYRGFNRFVYLRGGRTRVIVQYAVWDESVRPKEKGSRKLGELYDTFRWEHARRIGPHAPLGLPAQLEFVAGDTLFRAEAVADGDRLRLRVEPLADTSKRVVFLFVAPDGEPLGHRSNTRGVFAGFLVELEGATGPADYFLNVAVPYAVGAPGGPATLTAWPCRSRTAARVGCDAGEGYAETALAGEGALADAPQAMMQSINWNTVYDARRGLVCSPTCRDWCIDWRGPIVFGWDSFFAALTAAAESRELARANIEAGLAAVDPLGFVPNYFMSNGAASLDRSMPPLGAYAAWKIEQADPDLDWLKSVYPRLRRWHRFWMKNRGGRDGLLAWGSNPTPHYEFPQLLPYNPSLQHTAKCAMYEAGLDNSPMYDDIPFNPSSNTLELADVALNSYYALDCESLAAMAEALGRNRDAAAYRREYEVARQRINEGLWDEAHTIYANRHGDGRFSGRWSPTSFFPLLAGVPDRDRAERMVREHLLNEREFWGRYVIPSIARSDSAYPDNDYWRGRIWGPFNYLVAEGLRRYRLDDAAADLARRGLEMFLLNWHEDGGVYENYNAETGKGADVWNAARLYHWGGLLALTAIGELIDAEPAGFLRLGSMVFLDAAIRNFRLAGAVYDVELTEGVRVRRGGQLFLECSTRAIVRLPLRARDDGAVEIACAGAGRLVIVQPTTRPARVNGVQTIVPETREGRAIYTWPAAVP